MGPPKFSSFRQWPFYLVSSTVLFKMIKISIVWYFYVAENTRNFLYKRFTANVPPDKQTYVQTNNHRGKKDKQTSKQMYGHTQTNKQENKHTHIANHTFIFLSHIHSFHMQSTIILLSINFYEE